MKFFATVALLTTTVAAGPSEKLFNLKTSGASNSSHNNLYLSVGHGLISDPLNNEAIFSGAPASRAAAFSFVNGTVLLDTQTTAPWALDLINVEGVRKERAQISIKPTHGSKGFSVGHQASRDPVRPGMDGFAGQLFPNLHFLSKTVQEPAVPAGCDRIQLNAVPKSSA
ncbi:hypothetical protein PDIDSM_3595 [Penicillium digitatum]|nr:hypothetical protein PDIDSM_3595 [Penicillium digitatum]